LAEGLLTYPNHLTEPPLSTSLVSSPLHQTIRLIRSLGQFFVLSDVCYLNASGADTPFAAAMHLGPLNDLV
jgi:hypothetical protein